MKSDYGFSDKAMTWPVVALVVAVIAMLVAVGVLGARESEQNTKEIDTKARCESVGGKMGHSKCYKDGKEI